MSNRRLCHEAKSGVVACIVCEAGGRRQEAGGRRQETGDRRQETGGRRQEAGGRRQAAGGRSGGGRVQAKKLTTRNMELLVAVSA